MTRLGVWMNGEHVATWSQDRGAGELLYADSWLASPHRRSLSLSLPISESRLIQGQRVAAYFDNLLPDNERIRERMRHRLRAESNSVIDLLAAAGRDCVGAVQLLPAGEPPVGFDRVDATPLSEADVARHLANITADGALADDEDADDFRISIAGAQEKTALLRVGDQWCQPHGATPTTHILKLPLGIVGGRRGLLHSIENEWLTMRLLRAMGMPVADVEVTQFEDQKALAVERFDRRWMDGGRWIARLPQEDFCQATATPPSGKYENDGGPGIARSLRLLEGSVTSSLDRQWFVLGQLAFWMLAATDGHAKNFSIFLRPQDAYQMTPFYDVLSMWPLIGDGANHLHRSRVKMAMSVRTPQSHYHLDRILPRHWEALADSTALPHLRRTMHEMAAGVEEAVALVRALLPPDFPMHLWDSITGGLRGQSQAFLREFRPA